MIGMNKNERSLPQLDSDALRTFVAVAARGNVTHAADDLHRTQSAISVQVKRLEAELGVRLFEREARGMGLTPAGEKLLPTARSILVMLECAVAELILDPIEGLVSVGIPDDYGPDLLATILADFAQRHPLVDVNITCGFSVGFRDAVERGQLDLAVYASDERRPGGEVLLEEQTVWVASKTRDATRKNPLPIVLFDRSCWWRDVAIDALTHAGIAHRIAYSSESVSGVKAAVKAGLAVGVLARSTVEPSMRILGAADGMPHLPSSNLVLIRNVAAANSAAAAMTDAIRRGFTSAVQTAEK